MREWSGLVAVLLLGGCWSSHSRLGEGDDEPADAAAEDTASTEADAGREDAAT